MKFDPGKAWPHPVLRPPAYGDDYPDADFEVDIEVKRTSKSTAVEVNASFVLSEPTLLELLKRRIAKYALLVRSPQTRCRQLLQANSPFLRHQFPAGALSGRVEFAPFLVCVKALPNFSAGGWHRDFAERRFNFDPGTVLAEDVPKEYWIDTASERPLDSILSHETDTNLPKGRWKYSIAEERILILMSEQDDQLFQVARELADNKPEAQYLMNGLYLPALVAILHEIDHNVNEYQDFHWFSSLDQRLESVGGARLGTKQSDRLEDAQKILDDPFPRMPLVAQARMEGT